MKKAVLILIFSFAFLVGKSQTSDADMLNYNSTYIFDNNMNLVKPSMVHTLFDYVINSKINKDSTFEVIRWNGLDTLVFSIKGVRDTLVIPPGVWGVDGNDIHNTNSGKTTLSNAYIYPLPPESTPRAIGRVMGLETDGQIKWNHLIKVYDETMRELADSGRAITPVGKKWVIFGDSFSQSLSTQWPKYVINTLQLTGTVSNATPGNRLDDQLDTLNARIASDHDYLEQFNMLTLMVGINDFAQNIPLGKLSDVAGSATFSGYLKSFIETVYSNNSAIEMFIMTNIQCYKLIYAGRNSDGYNLEDMAIRISQICDMYGVSCVDLYHCSGINSKTFKYYLGVDSLHPSTAGNERIAEIMNDAFASIEALQGQSLNHQNIVVDDNIGIGLNPLSSLTTGNYNIGIGSGALKSATTSFYNIGIGLDAGNKITMTGSGNGLVAIGKFALKNSTVEAIGIGQNAGYLNTTGTNNLFIGSDAGFVNTTNHYQTIVGNFAAIYATGSNNTGLGYAVLQGSNPATGYQNTAVGSLALFKNTSGSRNVGVGYTSLFNNTTGTGSVAIGDGAGNSMISSGELTAVGTDALNAATNENTAIGSSAGKLTTTGVSNFYGGKQAGYYNLTGDNNIYIGAKTGLYNTASYNVAVGGSALMGSAGSNGAYNSAFGSLALKVITTGAGNSVFGFMAGYTNATGSYNTFLGATAGYLSTGSYNVWIGNDAGNNSTFAGLSNVGGIDVTNTTTPLIQFDFDIAIRKTKINGNLSSGVGTIADNDATPDVSKANTFIYNGTANSVTVTDLDNPVVGSYYTFWGNSNTYTLNFGAANFIMAGVGVTLGEGDMIMFFCKADNQYWMCGYQNNTP
jgi:lysophospholipase L1-like esterase